MNNGKQSGIKDKKLSRINIKISIYIISILDKNFPPHPYYKRLSTETLKISYSCMPNMASHISTNNKNIIQESKNSQHPNPGTCYCQVAENCPLNGNCKQSAVIYQADVTPEIDTNVFILDLLKAFLKRDCLIIAMNLFIALI